MLLHGSGLCLSTITMSVFPCWEVAVVSLGLQNSSLSKQACLYKRQTGYILAVWSCLAACLMLCWSAACFRCHACCLACTAAMLAGAVSMVCSQEKLFASCSVVLLQVQIVLASLQLAFMSAVPCKPLHCIMMLSPPLPQTPCQLTLSAPTQKTCVPLRCNTRQWHCIV